MDRFMKYLKDNWWDIGFVVIGVSIVIGVVMSFGIGPVFYSPEVWQLK